MAMGIKPRAIGPRSHLVGVSGQVHAQLGRLDVPDLQRAVAAAADQQPAVSGPGHLVHSGHVAAEGLQVPGHGHTTSARVLLLSLLVLGTGVPTFWRGPNHTLEAHNG